MEVPLNYFICNYLWGHEWSVGKMEAQNQTKLFVEVVLFLLSKQQGQNNRSLGASGEF